MNSIFIFFWVWNTGHLIIFHLVGDLKILQSVSQSEMRELVYAVAGWSVGWLYNHLFVFCDSFQRTETCFYFNMVSL